MQSLFESLQICAAREWSIEFSTCARDRSGLRAAAVAVVFDHDRFRRAGSDDDRGRAGLGDLGEGDRRVDGAGSLAMIAFPSGARVWLATGHTDMRNYVERGIMRSPGPPKRTYYIYINRMGLANQALRSA